MTNNGKGANYRRKLAPWKIAAPADPNYKPPTPSN